MNFSIATTLNVFLYPSKAEAGVAPGKKLVGIAGISMETVNPKPAVTSAAIVEAE